MFCAFTRQGWVAQVAGQAWLSWTESDKRLDLLVSIPFARSAGSCLGCSIALKDREITAGMQSVFTLSLP